MNLKNKIWNVIFPLFLSLSIYLLFRPHDVAINKLIGFLVPHSSFASQFDIANWIVYNLPGALWVYAFLSIFVTKTEKGILYCLIPLCGALGIEVLQYFGLTDGTYDWVDIFFYLSAWLGFMIPWVLRGNKVRWFRSSEKISRNELSILVFFFSILILADVF